jgi:hypothetical protein
VAWAGLVADARRSIRSSSSGRCLRAWVATKTP